MLFLKNISLGGIIGYIRAEEILPIEVIELIFYIPCKSAHRQAWGAGTQIKQGLLMRNQQLL